MKTMLTLIISFIFTAGIINQNEKYCANMKDGILVLTKGGVTLTSDVILNDSTRVTTDCRVIKKEGAEMLLKEGECIGEDGKIETPVRQEKK